MPYSATPPKPAITRSSSGSASVADVADRLEGHALAVGVDAGQRGGERLDLEAVDADDRVAVVQQVVRERESGRAHADDQRALARRRRGIGRRRSSGFQRVSSE